MLGISVYPYKEDTKETLEYIKYAAEIGYGRLFLNLLLFDESKINEFLESNKKIIKYAKEKNLEVYIDVNPRIFQILNVSLDNLELFYNLGVDGIRLDNVFNGDIESDLTYNQYNIKIELNASQDTKYIENIFTKKPNIKNLISCHNFYPQKYTGLSEEFYIKTTSISKKLGLRTAVFITSQNNAHGPHIHDDNLPTLEKHRYLDVKTQVKHLIGIGNIDDIIVSNSFASKKELLEIKEVYKPYIIFEIEKIREYSSIEKDILNSLHKNRGDIGKYLIRSTQSRVKYKKDSIEPINNKYTKIKKGTIYIGNNNFGQYKGELGIAKEDLDIDINKINIIGNIAEKELFLLDYIKEYTRFTFKIKEDI